MTGPFGLKAPSRGPGSGLAGRDPLPPSVLGGPQGQGEPPCHTARLPLFSEINGYWGLGEQ